MRILAVDDEELGLGALVSAILKAEPSAEVIYFSSPHKALEYVKENDIYAAFLDISMPLMSGTELGRHIKVLRPGSYIIFTTGYDNYMGEAFSLHASGYVLKPVTPAKIREELDNIENLRKNVEASLIDDAKRIRFQCFGDFEVFIDGKQVHFKYDKTKEILAYLVSRRGVLSSNHEIIMNVWDDDENHDSYFRGLKKDMVDTLRRYGAEKLVVSQKGRTGIDTGLVSCDYYDFLSGKPSAVNAYQGEFMSSYSWGELTTAQLDLQRY